MKNQLSAHQFKEVYEGLGLNLSTLGCVMLDVEPLKNMYSFGREIDGVALYYAKDKSRFWINGWVVDKLAHVTLLYGLIQTAKNYEKHIAQVMSGWECPEVEVEDIGFFPSPYPDEPYYCIVAHIKADEKLLEGHQRLQFLPHVDTFAGYKIHMTICYLAAELGEKYRDEMIEQFKTMWVGKKLKTKMPLNLGGDKK